MRPEHYPTMITSHSNIFDFFLLLCHLNCNRVLKQKENEEFDLCFHSFPSYFSAGVGRTGCFIVIDAMLERIKHEKTVDIYGHVTLMRSQRNYMVQTEDQYSFIHDALLEAVACGNTEVAARSLYSYIQKLAQVESGEHVTGMELEFKVWESE